MTQGAAPGAVGGLDPLDRLLTTHFAGKVVRKDLLHQIKGGDNVPSYVLEYLLGRYCASDDADEIRLGVEAVKDTVRKNYFRHDEANKAQSLVEQQGRHRFIDRVEVRFIPGENKYWAAMDNFSYSRIHVNERFYREYERLLEGGIWAIVDLEYHAAEDEEQTQRGRNSPFHVAEMRPVQLARFDLEEFNEGRRQFTRQQWLDVLLRSAGLEPAGMSHRLKLLLVARFLPFVEKNFNFIELGPRGTGKSYVYSQLSPYCILVSGGKASSANLFYNNARRQVGLVGYWDVVAFDEVGGMKVTDPDTVQIMKDYMANGRFSRGITQVLADASFAFVGNLNDSVRTLVQHPDMDLFQPLPREFDLALLDRLHFYLPGWEVPKNSHDLLTKRYGFVSDYLAEAFRALRKENRFDWAEQHVRFGHDVEGRDATAARKTVSGFVKLLHPDGAVTPEEIREYVELALESRRRIKEQLKRRGPFEFSKVNFTFKDLATGSEIRVTAPEDLHNPPAQPTDGAGRRSTPTDQPPVPPEPSRERYEVGEIVDGQFEVLAHLGSGGFSRVYKVRTIIDRNIYALKVFRLSDSAQSVGREIEMLRAVKHPNVVKAIWGGRLADGSWFLVSDFVQGQTLEAYATGDKRMSVSEAVRVGRDLLSALEAVHPDEERIAAFEGKRAGGELTQEEFDELMQMRESGIVHRDIKPQNLILKPDGTLVLIDFGIASQVGSRVMTNRGTPAYQSPDIQPGFEQWDVSPDLFATGVVLYELICHQHPYENSWPHVNQEPRDPRQFRPDLPEPLAEFLVRACAPYRAQRFASAREMRQALEDAWTPAARE